MDLIVIGGGMAGVASAYALHARGHRVRVVERHATVAQGATLGQSGAVLPSPLDVWFGAGLVDCQRRGLFERRPAHLLDTRWHPRTRRFARLLERTADPEVFAAQFGRLKPLADRAQVLLGEIAECHELEFEIRPGILHLFDTPTALAHAAAGLAQLDALGYAHRKLDAGEAERFELAVRPRAPSAGAVLLPSAQSANCALFVKKLKQVLEEAGVEFLCGRTALRVRADSAQARVELSPPRLGANRAHETSLSADAVVLAAGAGTGALLGQADLEAALGHVRLHAVNVPLVNPEFEPRVATLVDTARRAALTRFSHRVRMTGAAVLQTGSQAARERSTRQRLAARDELGEILHAWLPGIAKFSAAHEWNGVKLISADGLPFAGRTAQARILVNCAHGPAGWALALGTAQLLGELLDNASPTLPAATVAALDPQRVVV